QPLGQGDLQPGGHKGARPRGESQGLALRDGRAQVHAGRPRRLVGRQGQALGVRQAKDPGGVGHQAVFPVRGSAILPARFRATDALLWRGQLSAPSAVIRVTALASAPNTSADTSLATIQSQPFFASLARALASRSPVSAAKPTTRAGRRGPGADRAARMSGFSTSFRAGGPAPPFLPLAPAAVATRQSDTAAVSTATSTAPAAMQASCICRAV